MDILLKTKILLKFPLLGSAVRKEIYNSIKHPKGKNYVCEEPECQHTWKSNKLETKCSKCNSHRISLTLNKKKKLRGFDIEGVSFFRQEDSP